MHCGLDFGTSNSTLGVVRHGQAALVPLQNRNVTLPSALFYHEDTRAIDFGRDAITTYLDGGDGRLMRSIKSVLGTSLAKESTQIGNRRLPLKSVIADFIGEIKRRAEQHLGAELDSIVQGRPVHFVDGNNKADTEAENALRDILSSAGFRNIEFQFEPVAAARHFKRESAVEQLVMVADIGGGTSDFSVIRIAAEDDVLGTYGIRLGGTGFDQKLNFWRIMPLLGRGAMLQKERMAAPNWIFHDLATWSQINMLYQTQAMRDVRWAIDAGGDDIRFQRLEKTIDQRLGHHIAADVEAAKITLSENDAVNIDLNYVAPGLNHDLTLADLHEVLDDSMDKLAAAVDECLTMSGVAREAVDLVVLTGGSTEMPLVQEAIRQALPNSVIEPCDKFGAVGSGLALEAAAVFD